MKAHLAHYEIDPRRGALMLAKQVFSRQHYWRSHLCEKACFWIEGQQLGEQIIGFCSCLWKQVLYLPEYKESESNESAVTDFLGA